MANPFDDHNGHFRVLVNSEGQYSLWPLFADVPAGWQVAHPGGDRAACLEFIQGPWTDLRPASLAGRRGDTAVPLLASEVPAS
jgi:uncharacterized protein YbdZ (MbtH family)